jgi:hypothetical protein
VAYFRQLRSIALYHIQDRFRQKLDNRAFIGIFIGYDTAHRSWAFLNPKTGRKVRTIHARFFERSRDSEEHINMGTLIFDRKKWVEKAVVSKHRCQLWPKVLWPGLDDEKLGNTADEFPEPSELEKMVSDQMSGAPLPVEEKGKTGKTDEEDLAIQEHIDDDVAPPVLRTAEQSDLIVKGPKYKTLGVGSYIKKRIDMILGKRVRDVVSQYGGKIKVPTNTKFKPGNYKLADLKYDSYAQGQARYIKCIPSPEDMIDAVNDDKAEVNAAEQQNHSVLPNTTKADELYVELWTLVHAYIRKPWLNQTTTDRVLDGFKTYQTAVGDASE